MSEEEKRWDQNKKDHESFEKAILDLHAAIYGDSNGNMGMRKQLEEMYGVFVPVTMTGKAIIKTIMVLGAIAAAITTILELIGLFKSHKQ
jgi:hypothetical protein